MESEDLSAPVVPREELLQFPESTRFSGSQVQLILDYWGDFHCILNAVMMLVEEGIWLKWCNAKTYM